jgi:hypothetical protein
MVVPFLSSACTDGKKPRLVQTGASAWPDGCLQLGSVSVRFNSETIGIEVMLKPEST